MLDEEDEAAQFAEARPLVEAMFEMSKLFVIDMGNFLPHGGVMEASGNISQVSASDGQDRTRSTQILPILHDGLRSMLRENSYVAVAVSEMVHIDRDQKPAIKVLVEHQGGMCRALYLPFRKRLLGKPVFGDFIAMRAEPEVRGWPV